MKLRYLSAAIALLAASFQASAVITPEEVGLIINDEDPYSVAVGDYYRQKRLIPEANIVRVSIPVAGTIDGGDMATLHAQIWSALPENVQAVALAWSKPYVVTHLDPSGLKSYCGSVPAMLSLKSLSSSFLPDGTCVAPAAGPTEVGYNKNATGKPMDFQYRPVMMLAGKTASLTRTMIDTSIAADGSSPSPNAYLSDGLVGVYPGLEGMIANKRRAYNLMMFADTPEDMGDAAFMIAYDDYKFSTAGVGLAHGSIFVKNAGGGDLLESMPEQGKNRNRSILAHTGSGLSGSFGVFPYGNHSYVAPDFEGMINKYIEGDSLVEAMYKGSAKTGWEVLIGDPLTRPFTKPPVYVTHPFALQAGQPVTFSAESDNPSLQYEWDMPDGQKLTGATVQWTPPPVLASKFGKAYDYNLVVSDGQGGDAPVRTRRILLTTATPGFHIDAIKPAVINFGNATSARRQSVAVEIYDNESEFPILHNVVFKSGVNNLMGVMKQPRPFQRNMKIGAHFHTDKIPETIVNGIIPLYVSASRNLDTPSTNTQNFDTPAVIAYTFPRFGIYGHYSGYANRPLPLTVESLDKRWKKPDNTSFNVNWSLPSNANIINTFQDSEHDFPVSMVNFDMTGRYGPILATVSDSNGNSYTAKAGINIVNEANVKTKIVLARYFKHDVPKQCFGAKASVMGLASHDHLAGGFFSLDGVPTKNPICIHDTLPHEISYAGVTAYGVNLSASVDIQLSPNLPSECTFNKWMTRINENISYFVTPKCSDKDGRIVGVSYSVDGGKYRSTNGGTAMATKKFDQAQPVFTFKVREDHGNEEVFVVDSFQ